MNPALPALPDGTQIALVRQILAIRRRPDHASAIDEACNSVYSHPTCSEFRMSRAFGELLADSRQSTDDLDFITFSRKVSVRPGGASRARPGRRRQPELSSIRIRSLASCPLRSVRQLLRPMASVDSSHERWRAGLHSRYRPRIRSPLRLGLLQGALEIPVNSVGSKTISASDNSSANDGRRCATG